MPRSISVLIPTYQAGALFGPVLDALAAQEVAVPWDVLAIDSSSTDGTWELLGERARRFPVPLRRERIHKVEFDHGDTRNLLAARSSGELLVYLTQDAIPIGRRFLTDLAASFADPRVGAAYARNVPRGDADLLTRIQSRGDPGYAEGRREARIADPAAWARLSPHERRLLCNFNDVASAVRRDLWELHPFPRTSFGEDVLMARALLEAGYTVVYDDTARVEHSHDYAPEEVLERARIDARFNAEWLDRICVGSTSDARVLVERTLAQDREALEAEGLRGAALERPLARARALREAAFRGLHEGGRTALRRPRTRLLADRKLALLYVVHGFPPDTWAGTEVYTLNLAQEMQRRGHRCTVLAREGARRPVAEGGPPDFSVREDSFEGLRVLRMVHRLEHRSLRESYDEPRAEKAFAALLARERPDLVHFQHLIHSSAGLVRVAADAGLPTVLHCHDYWALCARVQLIRPDGVRCDHNMGSGCFLCVKERGLEHVARLERLDRIAGPALDLVSRGLANGRAKGRAKEGRRARWEGLADIRARQGFVVGAYAAADLRISPSRFLRQKLVDTAGFDPHTLIYSDNGMRTDHVRALAKRPDPEGRVRFGFVGSLVWYKGAAVLVRAMARLAGSRAVLSVHGDFRPGEDAHHAELERLAAGAAPRNVRFQGRFDNARLSEVYAGIDVLVVPSLWWENSPITIHEAFLTRTPVLASGIGGMAEFVRDGVDGLHFAAGDDADLAAKMRRFLDEQDLLERLSRDFPPVKTIAENAAELEFRYRALCARVRPRRGPRTLLDLAGREAAVREGAVEEQGADLLLVRPGRAAVEYDLGGSGGGPREITIEQLALGVEPHVWLGGRVLVDGAEVARLAPFAARGADEVRRETIALELAPSARRLRLESAPERGGTHLRIQRIRVAERAADRAPEREPERETGERIA